MYDFSNATDTVIRSLERRFEDMLDDHIEITSIQSVRGQWVAYIAYDGRDDRGHRGTVTFSCNVESTDNVTDLVVHDLTGTGFIDGKTLFLES